MHGAFRFTLFKFYDDDDCFRKNRKHTKCVAEGHCRQANKKRRTFKLAHTLYKCHKIKCCKLPLPVVNQMDYTNGFIGIWVYVFFLSLCLLNQFKALLISLLWLSLKVCICTDLANVLDLNTNFQKSWVFSPFNFMCVILWVRNICYISICYTVLNDS